MTKSFVYVVFRDEMPNSTYPALMSVWTTRKGADKEAETLNMASDNDRYWSSKVTLNRANETMVTLPL